MTYKDIIEKIRSEGYVYVDPQVEAKLYPNGQVFDRSKPVSWNIDERYRQNLAIKTEHTKVLWGEFKQDVLVATLEVSDLTEAQVDAIYIYACGDSKSMECILNFIEHSLKFAEYLFKANQESM